MAGAGKKRQVKERKGKQSGSSSEEKSPKSSPTDNSPKSHLSPPAGVDGNRDPSATRSRSGSNASQGQVTTPQINSNQVQNKNLDLGALAAFASAGFGSNRGLPPRPKQGNKSGREANITLNSWPVQQFPNKPVHQYDIMIGNGAEKRGLIRAVWESKTMQNAFNSKGETWIFDGVKLAWADGGPPHEARFTVNLDQDNGRTPRPGKNPDVVTVGITRAKTLDFSLLRAYLEGKADWGTEVLEAINFLDHLMREQPSKKFTPIKRNFFARGQQRTTLGGGIEAFKGVYASVRPVNMGGLGAAGLSVNVDVANTAFWCEWPLHQTAKDICGARDANHLAQMIGSFQGPKWDLLKRLRKLKIFFKHTKNIEESKRKPLVIDKILPTTAEKYSFTRKSDNGTEREVTVLQHFRDQGVILQYPHLPVVRMTKKHIVVPMEVCFILENQRFMYKLGEKQTSEMIKFAVTLPDVRWGHIKNGLGMLDWENDRFLASFGMRISQQPTKVKARILPNPKVNFGQRSQGNPVDPRTSGRWDLRGKVFLEPNKVPLKSWGVCILTTGRFSATREHVQTFMSTFINTYKGHGGQIAQEKPVIIECGDPAKAMEEIWNAAGNQAKQTPQLLVFVVPDKDSMVYHRIKKSCECRYGVVSQVMQAAHVQKNQQQYCSNVCMKVNAKLGGITARAIGMKGPAGWFTKPTLVLGVDVSHGAPGTDTASIAAITMSWDRHAIRYIAGVQTNGSRVEMVTSDNIDGVLGPMLDNWIKTVGQGRSPEHVIYVRDGVSEGQYPHVLNQELFDIRKLVKSKNPQISAKFTVVVASKRHNIRFFPDEGDKNKNPLPGTLVETGVTCPFEYDFYLCAHSAIKGTARPVHYHVLLDEENMGVEGLQNWIYESSYQFVRSTTPVSMFPAAYYAHLASGRALAHLNQASVSSGRDGDKTKTGSSKEQAEIKPLLPMPPQNGIRGTMWYV